MPDRRRMQELQDQITGEIIASRTEEVDQMRTASRAANEAAASRADAEQASVAKALGMDARQFAARIQERTDAGNKQYQATEAYMNEQSQTPHAAADQLDAEVSIIPAEAKFLTPVWAAGFSNQDNQLKLTRAAALAPRDLLTGGGCQDYWNYATGGGWGCLGSGVGEIQSWVEFGFWFYPPANRFYSVQPLFRFRGYYIVQADDGFWDCKSARTVVSAWTNVYQYNWKGWNHVNVLDVSDDNINVNNRFDTDRYTYNTYLLGGGDWAWIRCTIGLYARAQGGGSNAKNDFSTGDANFLCVPWCYVV